MGVGLFSRKKDKAVDPEERSPELGLKYKDLAVLGQLMEAGADLDNPRHVLHYLYFPDQADALAAAEEAQAEGWQADAREPLPEYPDQWSVVCERDEAVLTADFVRESTDFFESLAARNQGEYDGWEASLDAN